MTTETIPTLSPYAKHREPSFAKRLEDGCLILGCEE